MRPVVVLVGRPNVGKSTLFNRLTRSRDALVADEPGLTRDRRYGDGRCGRHEFIVVDTGGIVDPTRREGRSGHPAAIDDLVSQQSLQAIDEATVVFFMVDAREGLHPLDQDIARLLRQRGINTRVVVNKAEGLDQALVVSDFYTLGLGEPVAISAAHGDRVSALIDDVLETIVDETGKTEAEEVSSTGPRVAVVGRPNVGKSTLVNALLGEERVLTFDQPGTTRDSIVIPFERQGRPYVLVDTAGVRRRKRVSEVVEKFSIIKTLQAIDEANVVILVIDGSEGVTDQDLSLAGYVLERGRAVVVAVNKWDKTDADQRDACRREVDRRLPFLGFAELHFISALRGEGIGKVLAAADRAYQAATREMSTSRLNEVLRQAVEKTPPPMRHGRRIKLKFAHQGGRNPPTVVIHGNQAEAVPAHYRRYLINVFRKAFDLQGTPVRVEFRQGVNPFAGRRSKTDRKKKTSRR